MTQIYSKLWNIYDRAYYLTLTNNSTTPVQGFKESTSGEKSLPILCSVILLPKHTWNSCVCVCCIEQCEIKVWLYKVFYVYETTKRSLRRSKRMVLGFGWGILLPRRIRAILMIAERGEKVRTQSSPPFRTRSYVLTFLFVMYRCSCSCRNARPASYNYR